MRRASSSVALRLWLAACVFCESMAPRSSASRLRSWVNSASSPSRICTARARFAFSSCSTWAFTFWTSGWPSLNFSERRPSSTVSPAICVLKAIDRGVDRDLGQDAEVLAAPLHLPRLLERRLDGDPPGLGLHEVVVQLGDRGGDGGDAAVGHEEVLGPVALEEPVLGVPHALLGVGEALLEPLHRLAGRLDAAGERLLDVDVGEGVGPQRRLARLAVGDAHVHEPALRDGLDAHVGHEEGGGVGRRLEGLAVGELQAGDHLLARGPSSAAP